MSRARCIRSTLISAALAAALATPLHAQLPDASAVTLGLGGSATATARGLTAVSMNPAGLAMPGGGFALALLPIQLRAGLDPITLSDLSDWQGTRPPDAIKEEWVTRAEESGSQSGDAGLDVSAFALSTGRWGFQLSTIAVASMGLAPDIVELVLFGNAGRTGEAADFTLGGSELESFAVTTASAGYGIPLTTAEGSMALGVTLKYSLGHAVASAREQTGVVTSDPLEFDLTFPMVVTAEDAGGVTGSGIGVDVGFQMERGRWGMGAAVLNVLNTFSWDEDDLAYRPGTLFLDLDGSETDFDEQPFGNAPDDVAETIDDIRFRPVVSAGAFYRAAPALTLSADLRKRLGGGVAREPELHAGVGLEYDGFSALQLRGGVAAVTGGVQVAGGTTIVLGPVNFSFAGALRRGDQDAELGQFTLSFGGR